MIRKKKQWGSYWKCASGSSDICPRRSIYIEYLVTSVTLCSVRYEILQMECNWDISEGFWYDQGSETRKAAVPEEGHSCYRWMHVRASAHNWMLEGQRPATHQRRLLSSCGEDHAILRSHYHGQVRDSEQSEMSSPMCDAKCVIMSSPLPGAMWWLRLVNREEVQRKPPNQRGPDCQLGN